MATVGNTYLTIGDLYKRKDPDDQIAAIIELLSETNPILEDAVALECNDGTKHLTTVRTGLPTATWRMLYQGVQPSKSTTKQVVDTTGMLESWSEVDADLVEKSGNPGAFRLSEATAFLEGMNQEMATAIFYHNSATDPEKPMGLAPRFDSLSAETGAQIVNAEGAGADNTSIWFVAWSDRTCHLLYPKGSKAGLQRDDKGKETKTNADGSLYDVYREKFKWDLGFSVRDWRYVVRIANIDVSNMQAGSLDLYKFMRQAYYKLHQRKITGGRMAIYCNTDVKEALDAAGTNAGASDNFVRLKPMEIGGKEVDTYRGIPVRECDAIHNVEPLVS